MDDTLRIWRQVCETDPATTKTLNMGRRITTIDAWWLASCGFARM